MPTKRLTKDLAGTVPIPELQKQTHLIVVSAELFEILTARTVSTLQTHDAYEFAKTNPLFGIAEKCCESSIDLESHFARFG